MEKPPSSWLLFGLENEHAPVLIIDTRFQEWQFSFLKLRCDVSSTRHAYHRHSLLTTFLYFFKIFASGGLVVSHVCLLRFHGLQPTDSSVHGICQARILESIDISFSIKIFTTIILVQSISTVVQDTGQHKRYRFSERKVSEPKALDSLILLCMFPHKIYKEYHPQVDVYFLTH